MRIEPSAAGMVSGNTRAPLRDRKDDLYETHPVAVHALMKVEHLPATIWEPNCGPGAIVRVLRGAGHTVVATDLVDYGCPESHSGVDFLMEARVPGGAEGIVGNPPYKLATQCVAKANELCPYVAFLLRFEFVAGQRGGLFDRFPPARVHVFSNRLPRMHRAGWMGKQSTSRLTFAWFVWDRSHAGPTELRRITWKKTP